MLNCLRYDMKYIGTGVFVMKAKRVVEKKRIHVVASGPSIKKSLENTDNSDEFYMMNGLASTDYMQKYMVSTFFLFDPIFFDIPLVNENAKAVWDDLNNHVSWDMKLIVPNRFEKVAFQMLENSRIRLLGVRDTGILTENPKIDFFFYRHNLGIPPVGTVAMYAVYWAIQCGAKTIYLHGVDYSYEFEVDSENRIWQLYQYADGRKVRNEMKKYENGKLWKLYETLASEFKVFKWIDLYAKSRNIEILNASPTSKVDAYKKVLDGYEIGENIKKVY